MITELAIVGATGGIIGLMVKSASVANARYKRARKLARIPDPVATLYMMDIRDDTRTIEQEVNDWMDLWADSLKEQGLRWAKWQGHTWYRLQTTLGVVRSVSVDFEDPKKVTMHLWDVGTTSILRSKTLYYGAFSDLHDLTPEEAALVVVNEALLLIKSR